MVTIFPTQKNTYAEKTKKDENGRTWGTNCVDFLCNESLQDNAREEILKHYRLVDGGEMEPRHYEHVLNPLNTEEDRYKRFPTRLRNYDIITPVINLYAGEFSKRYKNATVLDSNPNDENRYKEGLHQMISAYYQQQTVNNLNSLGLETGIPSQEQPPVQEAIDEYNSNFDRDRVISGQAVLDYILYSQDAEDKYQEAYLDWIKSGIAVTYKGIYHNDIDLENVPPWEITLPRTHKSRFIEDYPWITRRQVLTVNEIIDRWHDVLTDDEITYLESFNQNEFTGKAGYVRLPTEWIGKDDDYTPYHLEEVNGIEVYHCQWRSFRKIGILTYKGLLGLVKRREVDDTYELDKENGDISIEWKWISQVWEGWKIDIDNPIYLDVRPLPYNRMELNNKSVQKLSYNGRVNRSVTGKLINLPSIGENFQIIYNILKYQFEKAVNKNKNKIAIIPQGLIPKGVNGWDEEKFMYFAEAGSLMVVDEAQPTAGIAMQGIKVLDLGLGQYLKECYELMQLVKAEWWDAIGMNRQRYGDSMASDGKAVTEQAIYRSAIISEELNRKFEKFQAKDYEGLLDLSKLAFLNGKKGKYVNSDKREAFLNINPDDAIFHLESDYNVHVINSAEETDNINMAREYAFSMGQNADAPTMLELIGSKNFEKTKHLVTKMYEMNKKREEALNESNNKSAEAIEQMKAETQKEKNNVEIYKADKDYDKVIDAKVLELENRPDNEGNNNDTLENHKMNMDKKDISLKEKKTNQDVKESNQKIAESKAKIKQMKREFVNNT